VLPLQYERQDEARVHAVRRFRRGLLWLAVGFAVADCRVIPELFPTFLFSYLGTAVFPWLWQAPWIASQICTIVACWIILVPQVAVGPRSLTTVVRAAMPAYLATYLIRLFIRHIPGGVRLLGTSSAMYGWLTFELICGWVWLLCLIYLLGTCWIFMRWNGARSSAVALCGGALVACLVTGFGLGTYLTYANLAGGTSLRFPSLFAAMRIIRWVSLGLDAGLSVALALAYRRLKLPARV
jgi:hypothetical protein